MGFDVVNLKAGVYKVSYRIKLLGNKIEWGRREGKGRRERKRNEGGREGEAKEGLMEERE